MQPNRYEQACKELDGINWEVPQEIPVNERNYNHYILIKHIDNGGRQKEFNCRVHKVSDSGNGIARFEKNQMITGADEIILMHQATQEMPKKETKPKGRPKKEEKTEE